MSNDTEKALRRLTESTTRYAELYPSLPQRMAEIAASQDPKVRRYTDDMAAALRLKDEQEKTWTAGRFGLTPRETQVALHLAGGGSIADYAAEHGLSEQTVRSQLKSIFGKTGVNRQAALAALFRPDSRTR